jgi:hypothetical protein
MLQKPDRYGGLITEWRKALPNGQASTKSEQREGFMIVQFSECVMAKVETPNLVLRATNVLMRFYPAVLRLGLVLQRFVQ